MDKNDADFTKGPLFSKMMFYTIPIILTGILQLLFNAADLVIAGQFGASKSNAVAAVGCTASLTGLMTNFFIGCSAGSGIAVAHAIGAKQSDAVYRAVHTIRPFAVIGGGLLSIIGVVLGVLLCIFLFIHRTVCADEMPGPGIGQHVHHNGLIAPVDVLLCALAHVDVAKAAGGALHTEERVKYEGI